MIVAPEKFYGSSIYFTGSDLETMYWMVRESALDEDKKLRLLRKLNCEYVTDDTYKKAMSLHARRKSQVKKMFERFKT